MWCCGIILSQFCDRECKRYVQVEVYKSRKFNAFRLKCSSRNFTRPKSSTVWSYRKRISFMGRSPCSSKFEGLRRRAWTANEDMALCEYIRIHGKGVWTYLPQKAGLMRSGKSCRLRWLKYLRPDIKRGNISSTEEELIIRLHRLLGKRWSLIAGRLPGRTDNEIKNYWKTYLGKTINLKERSATASPINTHLFKPIPSRITTEERHPPISYGNINEAFPLSVATNSSLSWSDQLLSISDYLPEKEGRNSICHMTQRSPHWDHFAGETANLGDNSLDMNELLSTNCYLFSSPSRFGLEELFEEFPLAAAETNEFHQGNISAVTVFNGPVIPSYTIL